MRGPDTPLQVSVWRGGADGEFRSYVVPREGSQTVLDVVTWIQRRLDPSLSFRCSCRVGMCGTCAMQINYQPRLACQTRVATLKSKLVDVRPLRHHVARKFSLRDYGWRPQHQGDGRALG